MNPHIRIEGSAGFKRLMTRAIRNLRGHDLVGKKIIERRRMYNVGSADAESGVIMINLRRLTAPQKRDLDLISSLLVHEDRHLRQGPVKDWNRDIARVEREAYLEQARYLEAVGNRKLAYHIRRVGRANIAEETRITYI